MECFKFNCFFVCVSDRNPPTLNLAFGPGSENPPKVNRCVAKYTQCDVWGDWMCCIVSTLVRKLLSVRKPVTYKTHTHKTSVWHINSIMQKVFNVRRSQTAGLGGYLLLRRFGFNFFGVWQKVHLFLNQALYTGFSKVSGHIKAGHSWEKKHEAEMNERSFRCFHFYLVLKDKQVSFLFLLLLLLVFKRMMHSDTYIQT